MGQDMNNASMFMNQWSIILLDLNLKVFYPVFIVSQDATLESNLIWDILDTQGKCCYVRQTSEQWWHLVVLFLVPVVGHFGF